MKPTNKTELARLYNVSYNTMINWIKQVPNLNILKNRRVLTPKEINKIFEHLGSPE